MRKASKCEHCHTESAEFAVQDIAGEFSVTVLGEHYRGFPMIKLCWNCKEAAIKEHEAHSQRS